MKQHSVGKQSVTENGNSDIKCENFRNVTPVGYVNAVVCPVEG
jgi:hypothetical protein